MRATLATWQAVADRNDLTFIEGRRLGESRLRGFFHGRELEIGLIPTEIRILTHFSMSLPGEPVPQLVDELASQHYLHARHDALIAYCKRVSDTGNALDAFSRLCGEDLGISSDRLHCSVRYVQSVDDYDAILNGMLVVARSAVISSST